LGQRRRRKRSDKQEVTKQRRLECEAMDAGRKKLKEEEQEVRNVYRTGSWFSGIMKCLKSILVVS
jgi:hypothetical protein